MRCDSSYFRIFAPCNSFSTTNLKFPNQFQLADDMFHVKGAIDLLIGAQVFFQLLKPKQDVAILKTVTTQDALCVSEYLLTIINDRRRHSGRVETL
jgi:hypothetical protein